MDKQKPSIQNCKCDEESELKRATMAKRQRSPRICAP